MWWSGVVCDLNRIYGPQNNLYNLKRLSFVKHITKYNIGMWARARLIELSL